MLLFMNSKNNNAKKDLCLAYSQGNKFVYPLDVRSMVRYLLLMYNIKSVNNHCDKKGDKNGKKGDEPKSEYKDNNNQGIAGAHIGKIQCIKSQTLLMMDLALAHPYLKSPNLILG